MNLPDLYGYGNLFAFSGIDGENSHDEDFAGVTMNEKISVRFDFNHPVTLFVPSEGKTQFVLSDIIKCDDALVLFHDNDTVIGRSEKAPSISASEINTEIVNENLSILETDCFFFALFRFGEAFALCRNKKKEKAVENAKEKSKLDIDLLIEKKLEYYRRLPKCPNEKFEKLYYKCLSINKVNVYSPHNGFDCRWTTPDRLPHKHMWLWDSMFHAMAIVNYNPDLAKEAIIAVLECQQDNGFIPHAMKSRNDFSKITQPQVIAWAILEVFKKTGDKDFLLRTKDAVSSFLIWFMENRDLNGNGLLEWETDFSNVRCRCDESGMDNSPRFDTTERLDAIDSSSFMVHDCNCMAEIYGILGEEENEKKFRAIAEDISSKINELLWDEKLGAYTDRTFSGELTEVLSCSSFLPLFAGVCTQERAERLAALLVDEKRFGTPLPVPSISKDNPDYGTDMWRGGVWLNYNYFIIEGLRNYGLNELADLIKEKTLDNIIKYFDKTGCIFEFYDPENKLIPWKMNRKGEQPPVPDFRIRYHSISDFNWSACFTLLMILDKK